MSEPWMVTISQGLESTTRASNAIEDDGMLGPELGITIGRALYDCDYGRPFAALAEAVVSIAEQSKGTSDKLYPAEKKFVEIAITMLDLYKAGKINMPLGS